MRFPESSMKPEAGASPDWDAPQNAGLVAWLPMLEGAGTATADVTGGPAAVLTNGATWAPGRAGSCLSLDGVDDYVSIPSLPPAATPYVTVAAWIQPSTSTRQDYIGRWGASGQRQFLIASGITSGKFAFFASINGVATNSSGNSALTLVPGTWYHVVGTWSGAFARIYVNGALESSAAGAGSPLITSVVSPLQIGKSNDALAACLIDDARIYPRALASDEVRELFYASLASAFLPSVGRRAALSTDESPVVTYRRAPGLVSGPRRRRPGGAELARSAGRRSAWVSMLRVPPLILQPPHPLPGSNLD
jgi:hypothetical protein